MDFKNNKGITLPIVLLALMVLIIFGTAILFVTSSQTKFNYLDDSSKTALEYAEAGYNEYLWHLNDDVNFYSTENHKEMMNRPIKFHDGYYMLDVTKPSDIDRFITIKSTGWTENEPDKKRTVAAKIRKKQFVHHVYVSNNDGDKIWWTTGDESHGAYHTNGNLYIEKTPKFYDTVTYSNKITDNVSRKNKEKVYLGGEPKKIGILEFPKNNEELKKWAQKDNMVFQGRTCIYLDGDYIKIRNGNMKKDDIQKISISEIKNKVIYVDGKKPRVDDKFNLEAGNIFISGKLKGQLTVAAANNIYITATDPTNWYEEYDENKKGQDLPIIEPKNKNELYGIIYANTKFNENKPKGTMSYEDKKKGIWTRDADGSDMLGLIAQNDILILHHGWPRYKKDRKESYNDFYWNYKWVQKRYKGNKYWKKEGYTYDVAPQNITIHAALFAVKGGFGYEDHEGGSKKEDITLWGNLTQYQRKAVGTFNPKTGESTTGYKKKYAHDSRMFYDYPPHILEPTNVGWEVHDWRETTNHVKEK